MIEKKQKQTCACECTGFHVRAVGVVNGPISPITQKPSTFHVVLGLFDKDNNQAVHTLNNGKELPVVWMSVAFPIEEEKILL